MDPYYKTYLRKAHTQVVKDILSDVAQNGLEGNRHYFITFATNHPGVQIPDFVKQKYPRAITIALQHQFFNLNVRADSFSVDLAFGGIPCTLVVPYAALIAFADPSASFILPFEFELKVAPAATPKTAPVSSKVIDINTLKKSKK
ncbi:MAG: ClpXP protease specificity-enhancing factor SspB [Lactobacillales bacterium]|jgi:hypothetical protein|nr:ClpXP protease specificity-enhancing factor SspB [Lactobacillales bacterium]